jgi:hypothetical protein
LAMKSGRHCTISSTGSGKKSTENRSRYSSGEMSYITCQFENTKRKKTRQVP